MHRRVSAIEEYINQRVEERVEQELEAAFDRLEQALPPEEVRRVLEILVDEEGHGA